MGANIRIEEGLLWVGERWITVGALLLLVYGAAALLLGWYGRRENRFTCRWTPLRDLSKRERRRLLTQAGVYVLLPLAWFFQETVVEEKNALLAAAKGWLSYGALIVLALIVLAVASLGIEKNPGQYLGQIHRLARTALAVSVLCALLDRQVDPWRWDNLVLFLVLGAEFIALGWIRLDDAGREPCRRNSQDPVESSGELFRSHRLSAETLARWISRSEEPSLSICVSGKWGVGKTSVVNGAIGLLRETAGCEGYEYIRVNALELDTLSSLYTYVFSQIKACLKRRGVYVGIGSAYRKFVASSLGVITQSSFTALAENTLLSAPEDYREQKAELAELLAQALGRDKLVVVVDDIERCAKEKARQFVFFMKEIATMDRCVSVFLTDYRHLTADEAGESPYAYFDKFFHRRLDIAEISDADQREAMEYYERTGGVPLRTLYPGARSPSQVFQLLAERWEREISNRKDPGARDGSEQLYRRFREKLSLPRTLNKIYGALREYGAELTERYQGVDRGELSLYFEKIRLDELLFFLAFVREGVPQLYADMLHRGWSRVEEELAGDDEKAAAAIWRGFILAQFNAKGQPEDLPPYHKVAISRFVEFFMQRRDALPEIVSGYSTQEQEWFATLDRIGLPGHTDEEDRALWNRIQADWGAIAHAILQDCVRPRQEEAAAERMRRFLQNTRRFEPGRRTEHILSLLQHENGNDWMLAGKTAFMGDIRAALGGSGLRPLDVEEKKRLGTFTIEYLPLRIQPLWALLHYLEKPDSPDHNLLAGAKERLELGELGEPGEPVERALGKFVGSICRLSALNGNAVLAGGDVFAQLFAVADELERFFVGRDMRHFPDIDRQLALARLGIADVEHFTDLERDLEGAVPGGTIREVTPETAAAEIGRLRQALEDLSDPRNQGPEQLLQAILSQIQYHPDEVQLGDEQVAELQELITLLYQKTGRAPVSYRKTLLDYQDWQRGTH